jgi:hypothetical protein
LTAFLILTVFFIPKILEFLCRVTGVSVRLIPPLIPRRKGNRDTR